MGPRFAQIAYQIDRVARPILGITTILALLLMVIAAFDTPAKQILTYILYVVAAIWVAEVTGRQVPSSSQFNEAIPSKAATKVAAARKELETLLSQNK